MLSRYETEKIENQSSVYDSLAEIEEDDNFAEVAKGFTEIK